MLPIQDYLIGNITQAGKAVVDRICSQIDPAKSAGLGVYYIENLGRQAKAAQQQAQIQTELDPEITGSHWVHLITKL
jgi:hypothetical protein